MSGANVEREVTVTGRYVVGNGYASSAFDQICEDHRREFPEIENCCPGTFNIEVTSPEEYKPPRDEELRALARFRGEKFCAGNHISPLAPMVKIGARDPKTGIRAACRHAYFTGAVRPQRVPPEYLASMTRPMPPLPEQQRIVADIDEIVRLVRFPGWQSTTAGEREVQKALRKTLLKYQLHRDQELFDRAYGYIRQYY